MSREDTLERIHDATAERRPGGPEDPALDEYVDNSCSVCSWARTDCDPDCICDELDAADPDADEEPES